MHASHRATPARPGGLSFQNRGAKAPTVPAPMSLSGRILALRGRRRPGARCPCGGRDPYRSSWGRGGGRSRLGTSCPAGEPEGTTEGRASAAVERDRRRPRRPPSSDPSWKGSGGTSSQLLARSCHHRRRRPRSAAEPHRDPLEEGTDREEGVLLGGSACSELSRDAGVSACTAGRPDSSRNSP